jgi:ubiquinone/menaquinone biosynthesis C-methylase UbiE
MAAYHSAFAPELQAMIESLPVPESAKVLDVACGDGTYSRWLSLRFGPQGGIWAIDISPSYLHEASKATDRGPSPDRILYTIADVSQLPFAPGTFDLAWCAQSLFSLSDPTEALRAIASSVRPGGLVAVLESDTLHQVMLPWPVELELALRAAELSAFADRSDHPHKFYVARRLPQTFKAAGLTHIHRHSWTFDRKAPLDEPSRTFLASYLADLLETTDSRLSGSAARDARRYLDPDSEDYMLAWPDFSCTVLEHLVWGQVAPA